MPEAKSPLYPESPYRLDLGAFPPTFENLPDGRTRIREERERQRLIEGYDLDHDLHHPVQELVDAAHCYLYEVNSDGSVPSAWPWGDAAWKPTGSRLRNLEKAGALYQAASDLMAAVANNVADLIDEEIHVRLVEAGVV